MQRRDHAHLGLPHGASIGIQTVYTSSKSQSIGSTTTHQQTKHNLEFGDLLMKVDLKCPNSSIVLSISGFTDLNFQWRSNTIKICNFKSVTGWKSFKLTGPYLIKPLSGSE